MVHNSLVKVGSPSKGSFLWGVVVTVNEKKRNIED
jgi:hypothetical protein